MAAEETTTAKRRYPNSSYQLQGNYPHDTPPGKKIKVERGRSGFSVDEANFVCPLCQFPAKKYSTLQVHMLDHFDANWEANCDVKEKKAILCKAVEVLNWFGIPKPLSTNGSESSLKPSQSEPSLALELPAEASEASNPVVKQDFVEFENAGDTTDETFQETSSKSSPGRLHHNTGGLYFNASKDSFKNASKQMQAPDRAPSTQTNNNQSNSFKVSGLGDVHSDFCKGGKPSPSQNDGVKNAYENCRRFQSSENQSMRAFLQSNLGRSLSICGKGFSENSKTADHQERAEAHCRVHSAPTLPSNETLPRYYSASYPQFSTQTKRFPTGPVPPNRQPLPPSSNATVSNTHSACQQSEMHVSSRSNYGSPVAYATSQTTPVSSNCSNNNTPLVSYPGLTSATVKSHSDITSRPKASGSTDLTAFSTTDSSLKTTPYHHSSWPCTNQNCNGTREEIGSPTRRNDVPQGLSSAIEKSQADMTSRVINNASGSTDLTTFLTTNSSLKSIPYHHSSWPCTDHNCNGTREETGSPTRRNDVPQGLSRATVKFRPDMTSRVVNKASGSTDLTTFSTTDSSLKTTPYHNSSWPCPNHNCNRIREEIGSPTRRNDVSQDQRPTFPAKVTDDNGSSRSECANLPAESQKGDEPMDLTLCKDQPPGETLPPVDTNANQFYLRNKSLCRRLCRNDKFQGYWEWGNRSRESLRKVPSDQNTKLQSTISMNSDDQQQVKCYKEIGIGCMEIPTVKDYSEVRQRPSTDCPEIRLRPRTDCPEIRPRQSTDYPEIRQRPSTYSPVHHAPLETTVPNQQHYGQKPETQNNNACTACGCGSNSCSLNSLQFVHTKTEKLYHQASSCSTNKSCHQTSPPGLCPQISAENSCQHNSPLNLCYQPVRQCHCHQESPHCTTKCCSQKPVTATRTDNHIQQAHQQTQNISDAFPQDTCVNYPAHPCPQAAIKYRSQSEPSVATDRNSTSAYGLVKQQLGPQEYHGLSYAVATVPLLNNAPTAQVLPSTPERNTPSQEVDTSSLRKLEASSSVALNLSGDTPATRKHPIIAGLLQKPGPKLSPVLNKIMRGCSPNVNATKPFTGYNSKALHRGIPSPPPMAPVAFSNNTWSHPNPDSPPLPTSPLAEQHYNTPHSSAPVSSYYGWREFQAARRNRLPTTVCTTRYRCLLCGMIGSTNGGMRRHGSTHDGFVPKIHLIEIDCN